MNTSTSMLLALVLVSFPLACSFDSSSPAVDDNDFRSDGGADAGSKSLTILSNSPLSGATGVLLDSAAIARFSQPMDPATLSAATFIVETGNPGVAVAGTVRYSNSIAYFQPSELLALETVYKATITTATASISGQHFDQNFSWSFTSGDGANSTLPVDLASAGDFVILAKTAITNVPTSAITGDLGISPAKAAGITGFPLTLDPSGEFATTPEVTGRIYASDYAVPTPAKMASAILDMQSAYTEAASRIPDVTEVGGVDIGGTTFDRGVYKWDGAVELSSDVTVKGSATDVWIFQVAGALTVKDSARIVLAGGARSKNIFWQASGAVLLEPAAHCEGVILTATAITLITGASVNGRLLAQTAVTLGANAIAEPLP